jgi:hypothetical protein
MKCETCKRKIRDDEPVVTSNRGQHHIRFWVGAERSGVRHGCLPSTAGSPSAAPNFMCALCGSKVLKVCNPSNMGKDGAPGVDSSVVRLTEAVRREEKTPAGCPFCGSAPEIEQTERNQKWWVFCANPICPAIVCALGISREEAILKWNDRAGDPKPSTAPTLPRSGGRAAEGEPTKLRHRHGQTKYEH